MVAFTGSKTMDDSTSAVGFPGQTSQNVTNSGSRRDQYNRRLDWAVSVQDISRRYKQPGAANADLSLFKNNHFGHDGRYDVQFAILFGA